LWGFFAPKEDSDMFYDFSITSIILLLLLAAGILVLVASQMIVSVRNRAPKRAPRLADQVESGVTEVTPEDTQRFIAGTYVQPTHLNRKQLRTLHKINQRRRGTSHYWPVPDCDSDCHPECMAEWAHAVQTNRSTTS
jgi:hypothetical protein